MYISMVRLKGIVYVAVKAVCGECAADLNIA